MKPPRPRRVQAQRKFAQGAYVPPNMAAAVVANDNRREIVQDTRNVTISTMSASGMLDVISMQDPTIKNWIETRNTNPTDYRSDLEKNHIGIHAHLTPVVLVERISDSNHSCNSTQLSQQTPENVVNHKLTRSQVLKMKKDGKRVHMMALRSCRVDYKQLETSGKVQKEAAKRKIDLDAQKMPKPKKRTVEPSEFSADDNKPLKFFAKQPAPVLMEIGPRGGPLPELSDLEVTVPVKEGAPSTWSSVNNLREPVAGPSGLSGCVSPWSTVSSLRGSYYNSEHNIHRWMNSYLTPESVSQDFGIKSDSTPPTAVPPTTVPPAMGPPTTVPPTAVPPTSVSPATGPPATIPPTTVPPITVPPTTVALVNVPPAIVPPTTVPPATVPPATGPPTTDPPTTDSPTQNAEEASNLSHETATPCIAEKWRTFQDVIDAPQEELESRCQNCRACERIAKLIKLSSLLKTQVEFDLTGSGPPSRNSNPDENPAKSEDEDDADSNKYLYLDLLPKHNAIMMKLCISVKLGKEMMSACIIPRCDARPNKQQFLLREQEHLLDQVIETLTLSLNRQSQDRESNSSPVEVESDDSTDDPARQQARRIAQKKRMARKRKEEAAVARLKDASELLAIIKMEKEAEVSRIEAEKQAEVTRIELEKQSEVLRIEVEKREELSRLAQESKAEICRLEESLRVRLRLELEAELRMMAEVEQQAKALEAEKDAKCLDKGPSRYGDDTGAGSSGSQEVVADGGKMLDAPVYRPSHDEFEDPIAYFEKIFPDACKYGICKIVPPLNWKPTSKIVDDIRFNASNQYISRLFSRWGPATRELCAIKLCLMQQKIHNARAPLLEGVEVNLAKLYHVVQRNGGLESVINRQKWGKVAEEMKFNKSPLIEKRLDRIYVKYLLSYDTLAHHERQDIMRNVEKAWHKKNQKLLDRALNPLQQQKRMLGLCSDSEDESEDENTSIALKEAEDCITSGAAMTREKFRKIAANAYDNLIGSRSEEEPPTVAQIEEQYWGHVLFASEHLCVNTAAIDTGEEGYGFTKDANDPYGRHPWNLKMLSQNPRNMLRYLGSVLGVTVPTLHLGMIYSTSCWHKDPHCLPWIEYEHSGPSRIWYGIPSNQTDNFRKAVETLCPTFCQNKGLWLSSDIAMIPPTVLRQHNVTLTRITQEEREFIVAFPNAYTCCISTGYTESESVYFAPPSWVDHIPHVFTETRASCEPTMFCMEELILLMAKDQSLELSLLRRIQPIYDKMMRDEVTNRQMLQERGLKFVRGNLKTKGPGRSRRSVNWNVRENNECEYCRATLFLSKVLGVNSKNSILCLEHALKLLDTELHKNKNVSQLEVYVFVSVRELNAVGDEMKRRLGMSAS